MTSNTAPGAAAPPGPAHAPALPHDTQLALALLDGAVALHQDVDRKAIASLAVAAVERACPDAAAAFFEWIDDAAMLALRAAGPRWRTAEREAPAWLVGECGAVAQLLKSASTAAGRLPAATDASTAGAAHLVAVPVAAPSHLPAILVVIWPSPAEPAAAAAPLLERFARHVSFAMARGKAEQVGRAGTELQEGLQDAVRQQQLCMLGELARGLVHDLNNTMTTIVGTADWLLFAISDQSVKGDLERLRAAALDAAALVKRVRLLRSSGEAGREVLDLVELAESAIDIVRGRMLGAHSASTAVYDLRVEPVVRTRARGNPTELRELLVNLLNNSIEAMPDGGTIVMAVGGDEHEAWIDVRDEGHGIPETLRDRIFDPFVTSRDRNGAGLGLSVCWSIARAHGGRLVVGPREDGPGTTALLMLPASAVLAGARPLAPVATLSGPRRALRILLVDDQDDVRKSVGDMLTILGHEVIDAPDAEGALAVFSPEIDLVITDWVMPGLNGTELAREISRRRPGIPVLLLTGWGSVVGAISEPAVAGVLSKPVTLETLRDALATYALPPDAGGAAA